MDRLAIGIIVCISEVIKGCDESPDHCEEYHWECDKQDYAHRIVPRNLGLHTYVSHFGLLLGLLFFGIIRR